MPIPTNIRNDILDWIQKGISYTEIIERVKKEGFDISRGGITYLKNKYLTEQKTEQTKQKQKEKPVFTSADILYKEQQKKKKKEFVRLLSDLEFKNFKRSVMVIVKSNYKRLKSNRATGIMNALTILTDTLQIIEKRGKY